MTFLPRPYRDLHDLDGMRQILISGRRFAGPVYYVHPGDLNWWLYYLDQDFSDRIYIWENEHSDRVLGWVLFSPRFNAFDVFVDPDPSFKQQRLELFTWAEEHMTNLVCSQGGKDLRTMWVSEHDYLLIAHLERRGFVRDEYHLIYLEQSLAQGVVRPQPPPGYRLRNVSGRDEIDQRALVSYLTFGSKKPFDHYKWAYLQFMNSPVYSLERDLVVEAAQGEFAAFCIYWVDKVNHLGYFEPVGTHPDYRRQGLGAALIREGLWRIKADGMLAASVCVESDNPIAQRFYASLGFQSIQKIHAYSKNIYGTLIG